MKLPLRCIAVSALFAGFAPLHAQDYPAKPVRVIVPYPPGGITDVMTRTVALEMARTFGQSFVVDNRPGANSILGVDLLAKATADGYTLGTVIAAHAANQTLYPKLPYDSMKSFEQVSLLGTAPLILCATNSLAANSVKELVELAKVETRATDLCIERHRCRRAPDDRVVDDDDWNKNGPRAVQRHGAGAAGPDGRPDQRHDGHALVAVAAGACRQNQSARHGVGETPRGRAGSADVDRRGRRRSSAAPGSGCWHRPARRAPSSINSRAPPRPRSANRKLTSASCNSASTRSAARRPNSRAFCATKSRSGRR